MMIMGLFAIGTLPWLIGLWWIASIFKGSIASIAYKIIGWIVFMLGLYTVYNALPLLHGWMMQWWSTQKTTQDNPWTVPTEKISLRYTEQWLVPNVVNLEKWKNYEITITPETTVYGCMSTITIPWLDNSIKPIATGTPITFTVSAEKSGTYDFLCAMGISHWAKIVVQ
jgi:hypothetical protein